MLEVAHQEEVEVTAADSDCFVVRTTDLVRLFGASDQYQVSLCTSSRSMTTAMFTRNFVHTSSAADAHPGCCVSPFATALSEHEVETVVNPPNSAEVDLILGPEGRFISSMTDIAVDETSVSLAFMRSDWQMSAEIHHTHWLTYHFNGLWEVSERSSS